MKTLSIAIPTYNMENYLSKCIDSLITNQSILPHIEIIIVNDGSKDNSLKIAQSYQIRFPESIIIIDKSNGNYGSCVNIALQHATGKYFRILDADDCFYPCSLTQLIQNLEQQRPVDMVVTNYETNFLGTEKKITHKNPINIYNKVLNFTEVQIEKKDIMRLLVMHKLTYRTKLLKDMQYSQLEKIPYTDLEYVFYPLSSVKTLICYDITLYRYSVGRAEQSVSIPSRIRNSHALLKIINRMISHGLSKDEHIKTFQEACLTYTIASYFHILLILKFLSKEDKNILLELDQRIQQFNTNIYIQLNKIKCLGLPYIYIWRKYHFQIISPLLYRTLKKINSLYFNKL